MYNRRALDDASYQRVLFEACHPEVAKCCRSRKNDYPAIDEHAELLEPVTTSQADGDENFSGWIRKMKI
jgi:hypothetical protein